MKKFFFNKFKQKNKLAFQNEEKEKRALELVEANKELAFQNDEKEKRAAELVEANKELAFQNEEKEKRAAELIEANKELAFQNDEKEKRTTELIVANKELAFQNDEKENRAAELVVANKELAFQNDEKENRAAELIVANKELAFQNEEKENRAAELIVANKELAFQNEEKEKRAAELVVANKELAFQNDEKEKRTDELNSLVKKLLKSKEFLFQREQEFRALVENNPDTVSRFDKNFRYLYINHPIDTGTGISAEKVIGMTIYERGFSEDFISCHEQAIGHVFSTGTGKTVEMVFQEPSGLRHYENRWEPEFAADGSVETALCISRDITERKLAERQMNELNERFLLISKATNDCIYDWDLISNQIRWSEALSRNFNYPPEITETDIHWWEDKIHPDDIDALMQSVQQVFDEKLENWSDEYRFRRFDGSYGSVFDRGIVLYDKDKNPIRWIGSFMDISEHKQAEEKIIKIQEQLQESVKASGVGLWNLNLQTNETYMSPEWKKQIGYDDDELKNEIETYQNHLHPDNVKAMTDDTKELIEGTRDTYEDEYRLRHKDGSYRWIFANAAVKRDKNGKPLYLYGSHLDITASKLAEEKINLMNQQLNLLLENSPIIIYTCNAFGNFDATYISQNIKGQLGYDSKEFLETPHFWANNIHPDDKEAVFNGISKLFENGEYWHQYKFKHKNGTWRWMSDSLKLIMDENGAPKEILGYWEDITEERQAAEEIKNSETRFRTLYESIDDAIFLMDKGVFTECNTITPKMFGCARVDIIGHSPIEFSPEKQKDGRLSLEKAMEKINAALNGKPQNFEWTHCHLDGSLFEAEVSLSTLELSDKVFIRAIVKDITERKQAEESIKIFAQAIKNSGESICLTDVDNKINFVNKAMCELYGYSQEEFLGQNIEMLRPKNDSKDLSNEIKQATIQQGNWQNELINVKKDGTEFPVFLSTSQVIDEYSNIISFIGIARDITEEKNAKEAILNLNKTLEQKVADKTNQLALINENLTQEIEQRKQAEMTLINAKHELEKAIVSKSELFSRVSHELRTPLNGILGFAQLLEMGDLAPAQKKGVNQILKSGRHLLDLVNEVLELSKSENFEFTVSLEPVYLKGIILETVAISQPFAIKNNIAIETENLDEENIYVLADYQKLTHVLLNIINNAIKYNKDGGLVTVKATKIENQKIRISITDTGEGIPEEEFFKLFKPFLRIGTNITDMEGTGLGLAVSKKLTEAMKGTIGAESEAGKGSTFWIELLQDEGQLERYERETVIGEFPVNNNTKTKTLLYIENNIANQNLIKQIINTHRPAIQLIASLYGKDTVKLAVDYKPDLILLDLDLSNIHGIEVIGLMKKNPQINKIPVIILSADDKDKQIKKLLNLGVKAYLTKPLNLLEFLKTIDEIMND